MVVLAGDRAYKMKKPVLTDFLDFRTVEQRERACRREVALNSRLSPDSYLGVAHLSDPAGGPAEPVIVMRRYRDDQRLASRVARDRDGSIRAVLDAVADTLARFHERAERNRVIDAQGDPGTVERRWLANLTELDHHVGESLPEGAGEQLARLERLVAAYVAGRGPLFGRRVEDGCIVDGHGDLLADDIFWVEGRAVLLDCLEFDDALRHVDWVDDAAFLAMDLEFLGRKDLADYFLDRHAAHLVRTTPLSLRDFYIAYRAVVRAKTDCVRVAQGRPEAADDATRHLDIATRHLQDGAVRLALVGGNPGTGKSTVARALAAQTGAKVIATDDIREELRESGVITGPPGVLDQGLYSRDNVTAVYEVALRRARSLLGNGHSVILDATWRDPWLRAQARRMAGQTSSATVELVCETKAATAGDRIRTRRPGTSQVTPEIAAAMAARRAGWDTAQVIDTSRPLDQSAAEAHDVWRRAVSTPQVRS
ncbi:hypothetical protein AWC20_07140 [Mycobacterium parmense]|nr:bifunctional aminoglycoside phosphotransferase/ATP-binding protein [Mycobacterium parmense]ORW61003.1 hypothetical protein AWC20_07140 [Mycobacterium parmense]